MQIGCGHVAHTPFEWKGVYTTISLIYSDVVLLQGNCNLHDHLFIYLLKSFSTKSDRTKIVQMLLFFIFV
jgi:hypothetical protein